MIDAMMDYLTEPNLDDFHASPADESAIFLAAMQESCTAEEYQTLVMESATELELYGLINSADIATEAQKIVYKQTKQQQLTREQNRMVMRMGKRLDLPEYRRYKKFITLALQERNKLRQRLGSKAKQEVKRSMANSKRKASSMNSANSDKLMQKIKQRAAANEKIA